MKIYILLCLVVGLCCSGCSNLIDIRPENSTTYTNYFRTQKDAEALLTELQIKVKLMMDGNSLNSRGYIVDDDAGFIPNKLELRTSYGYWGVFYYTIYQADLIIDNVHRFELSKEEIEPYLLQAYFAKGVAYFYLAMNFGEVPITKGSTNFDKLPQSSVGAVLDEAEKWALKAMDLPKYEDMFQTAFGARMKQYGSKGAAAALLAHLYAWRAGMEGKSECWEKAEEYCRMIIDGETGNYQLAANPEEVCTTVMYKNSNESIWEIYCNGEENETYLQQISLVGFPVVTTSEYSPDNVSQPSIYKNTVRRMYDRRDLRGESYFWNTDADSVYLKYINGNVEAASERGRDSIIMVYDNQNIQRAYLYKFRYPYYVITDWSPEPSFEGLNQNKIIWRLADIYLLRAECRARQNKANAVDDLNKIRSRAYGDLNVNALISEYAYPCTWDVRNNLAGNIQLAIFREREKELLLENHRYFDIVRNGWCYLRGEDSYDYIRNEISDAYAKLTDQDIQDGALYFALGVTIFTNNDLIRQNKYWNRCEQ